MVKRGPDPQRLGLKHLTITICINEKNTNFLMASNLDDYLKKCRGQEAKEASTTVPW